jgi:D-arginine utilization repressor
MYRKEMNMKGLEVYFSVAQAISQLLYPYGEVVIHDLKTQRIAAIFNNFSKRKVGDESLLEEMLTPKKLPDVFPTYFKTNWDGRNLKCITATLKNQKDEPIGLLCVNLDVSKWEEMENFLQQWLQVKESKKPELLFKDDWRERINTYVSGYLKKKALSLKHLDKETKKEIILTLQKEGAFKAKNAAHYIADILNISRATLYNYLRRS